MRQRNLPTRELQVWAPVRCKWEASFEGLDLEVPKVSEKMEVYIRLPCVSIPITSYTINIPTRGFPKNGGWVTPNSSISNVSFQTPLGIQPIGTPMNFHGLGPGADGSSKATYLVHDNGGRPFKVLVQPGDPKAVRVFKAIDPDEEQEDEDDDAGDAGDVQCRVITAGELRKELGAEPLLVQMADDIDEGGEEEDAEEDEELPKYEEEPCISFSAERVFVGESPKHGARFDGNSLLLHLEGLKYVFVGESVFSFTAKSPITKYVSPVGNNDVPYPWAMDEQGFRYLMISSVIVTGKLFENSDADPYELFFDRALMTADIGMVPPTQPFHAQFQGITEFWIGEDQYTFRYEPQPENDFDRLAEMGELSVVKGGEKVKLSKEDYVKLMHDFADFAGFESLHCETLVERNIIWIHVNTFDRRSSLKKIALNYCGFRTRRNEPSWWDSYFFLW